MEIHQLARQKENLISIYLHCYGESQAKTNKIISDEKELEDYKVM